ncbi:MAG: hypothetical protein ACOH5I_19785 [Oligoflexus sp.]
MPIRNVESMIYVELAAYAFNILLFFLLSFHELSGTASLHDVNLASLAFPTLFFISLWLFLRKIDPREFFSKIQQGLQERSTFLNLHLMFSLFLGLLYGSSLALMLIDRIALPSWIFHFAQNALGMSFVFSMVLALFEAENRPKGPRKKKKRALRLVLQTNQI